MKDVLENSNNCTGCSACLNICPKNAIKMFKNSEGFAYPKIDESLCIKCGKCKKVCPCLLHEEMSLIQHFYATWTKNENVRKKSSSGGIFYEIAKYVLENNGVVYGAAFDGNFNLKHVSINKSDDVSKLMGSKYLQSDLGNIFKDVKTNIDKDLKVLFVGTPCQVAGLKKYINKECCNLITCDLICHGVPSPLVFKNYLDSFKTKKIEKINFRDKSTGWNNYSFTIDFSKNTLKESHNDNLFMKGFLHNIYLRNSCYNCKFANLNRLSDITLGDFWNCKEILQLPDDDKGVSLIITNTSKGQKLLEKISDNLFIKEVSKDEALKTNLCLTKGVDFNKYRNDFFANYSLEKSDLKFIVKYTNASLFKKIKGKIKLIMRKVIK